MKRYNIMLSRIVLLVCVFCLVSSPIVAKAADYLYGSSTHWEKTIGAGSTYTPNAWKLKYTGYPAGRDGETDSGAWTQTYSHNFSGSFGAGIKEKVQIELGYTFGKEISWSVTKTSGSLKKGEYVKMYSRDCWEQKKVTSKECDVKSWLNPEKKPSSWTTHTLTGTTKTAYANEALAPQIKVEYWKDGAQVKSGLAQSQQLVRIEIYTIDNGHYVRVD